MPIANKISALWIIVLFNMVFADILGFMYPDVLSEIMTGTVEGVTVTPAFLLLAALLIEIAIVMIYLTRALPRKPSRVLNLGATVTIAAFVIGGGTLKAHYIFFASVEVATLIYIAYLAWTWPTHANA